MTGWEELTIAVVGGDEREAEIARLAAETGAEVRIYGFATTPAVAELVVASPEAALEGARFALFPIPGLAADGTLFAPDAPVPILPDEALLRRMAPRPHLILGTADEALRIAAADVGATLHEYEGDRQLMLERIPAIVEGALQICIERTDVTIAGARAGVVGFGNVGAHLARTLRSLAADVHVFARNPVQRAEAEAFGARTHDLSALADPGLGLTLLFSTVPAPVVDRAVLSALPEGALTMDLAAPPGGVDREAAAELGVPFVWARGLGRRAPVTVGASQWGGIRSRIETIEGGIS